MRLLLVLLALAPLAAAGTADAPEVVDEIGDCAFPHGAAYLDLAAVWIENEDEDRFDVVLSLARFEEAIAEGAGYTVQFEHQTIRWGVLALFRPATAEGWEFFTGRADAESAAPETFAPADGAFAGGAEPTIRISFAKSVFPHDDPEDRELRAFRANSADLRTAYPFLLGVDRVSPGSSNGRWLVCDEAASDATYRFARGAHSHAHAAPASEPEAPPEEPPVEASATTEGARPPAAVSRETPGPTLVAVALALFGAALTRSGARP